MQTRINGNTEIGFSVGLRSNNWTVRKNVFHTVRDDII